MINIIKFCLEAVKKLKLYFFLFPKYFTGFELSFTLKILKIFDEIDKYFIYIKPG